MKKFATVGANSPSPTKRRDGREPEDLCELNLAALELELSKLKPNKIKQMPCFKSPSREDLVTLKNRISTVTPAPNLYRPKDPRMSSQVVVKIN